MGVSNHPGLMATQLWQSTQSTSQEFSLWLTRRDEREERRSRGGKHSQRLLGRYSWLPQQSCEKKKMLALCLLHVESVVLAPPSVPDHYHVPLTCFRMKLWNSEPGCDI